MENTETQEIDLRELIFALVRRWWIIAICFIACTLVAIIVSKFIMSPVYEAKTSLFVGQERSKQDAEQSINYDQLRINQTLVDDYRQLAKINPIVIEVINNLGLEVEDIEKFKEKIGVNSIQNTRLFTISFQDEDPILATKITNELANVFINNVTEIVPVENIQIVEKAEVPEKKIKPRIAVNTVIGAVLGFMIGVFIVLMIEFFDNTLKTPSDVEKYLGLNVIGSIPTFEGEERRDV